MNKIFLSGSILALSLIATISKSAASSAQLPSAKEKEPTMLDRWNEIKRQAALATGGINFPPPHPPGGNFGQGGKNLKSKKVFFFWKKK